MMQNSLHLISLSLCFNILLFSNPYSQDNSGIPSHVIKTWDEQVGLWITDNSAYQNEPYDKYGLEWTYGLGKKTLRGRLFCIKDDRDIGSVWEFLIFWDPEIKEVRIIQTGSNGALGKGINKMLPDGTWKSEEKFYSLDGTSSLIGHEEKMIDGKRHVQSFNIIDGEWQKKRFYIWEKEHSDHR